MHTSGQRCDSGLDVGTRQSLEEEYVPERSRVDEADTAITRLADVVAQALCASEEETCGGRRRR